MKILVIGGGGREHALVWKLRQSPRVTQVICAPGNGGIAEEGTCIPGDVKSIESLVVGARNIQTDLTVVGPELTLFLGVVDESQKRGWPILGRRRRRQNSNPASVSPRNSCSDTAFRRRTTQSARR